MRAAFAAALGVVLGLVLATGTRLCAQPLEPPPESESEDYTFELADTLTEGEVETAWSASGRRGEGPRRAQAVRFRSRGTEGRVRDGDDPLAGGRLDVATGGGRLRLGRLAPRWGRGLVLGAAAEPWSSRAGDRGGDAGFRGRSGEGLAWSGDGTMEVLAGRFARRDLAGVRMGWGGRSIGVLSARGAHQWSAAWEPDEAAVECAMDDRGRWRVEGGWTGASGPLTLTLHARGGAGRFAPLAEPRRAGPARALGVVAETAHGVSRIGVHAAWWRFAPGLAGRRGALEVSRRVGQHGAFAIGAEEQHGTRRERDSRPPGLRQGVWGAWRTRSGPWSLALQHELHGARPFARAAVRRALAAEGEVRLARGASVTVRQVVWRVARGERSYLPELDADRLTLRALTGEGERLRVELRTPMLGGLVRLGATTQTGGTRAVRPVWLAQWTRRSVPRR